MHSIVPRPLWWFTISNPNVKNNKQQRVIWTCVKYAIDIPVGVIADLLDAI